MSNSDPNINPETAPVVSSEANQPYAKRTIKNVFWIAAIVVAISFFAGWFFFSPSMKETSQTSQQALTEQAQLTSNPLENKQNNKAQTSPSKSVYSFFYALFSGAEDGLEENPHNLENVDNLDQFNIDNTGIEIDPVILASQLKPQSGNLKQYESYFDGKILDDRGNVAGDISAIKYDDGEIKSFNFILKTALTPADAARRYTISEDEVKVVNKDDLLFIQLNKAQTQALAKELYNDK